MNYVDSGLARLKVTNQRNNDHSKDLVKLAGKEFKAEYIYFENGVKETGQKHELVLVAFFLPLDKQRLT